MPDTMNYDDHTNSSPGSSMLESLPGLFSRTEEGVYQEYYFSELSHALNLLQGLNRQRLEGALCDVTICVEGHEFPCHRNVLAACSPYFLAMFAGDLKESGQKKVSITGMDPDIMKQLIDYSYTSDITITQENAQHLLSAANMVQISSIRDACCNFLQKEMEPSNCLGIHCFAEAHMCVSLAEKAKEFALENFSEVAQDEEILLLPQNKLIEIIQSDELNVESEEIVFQAVMDWVKHDMVSRQSKAASVFAHVRLPLVNPYFLFDMVEAEPLVTETKGCRELLDEAKKFYVLKDRQAELQNKRSRPRLSQSRQQVLITIGGEIYNKNFLTSVDGYNLSEGKWLRLKELPFPRCLHGCVVSDGHHIYVAGGFNREKVILNNVLRYEPVLDKWIKVANTNSPRARHGMAAVDGHIYAVGGSDGQNTHLDAVECYSPLTNSWSYVAKMSMGLSRCCAVGMAGYLYVAGGTTDNNQCVATLQRYDPRTNTWLMLRSMPEARCLGGLLALRGRLYAVAGTEQMVTASRKLCSYDPHTDTWTKLREMIEPRFDAGVVGVGGKIYVLSGHDGENSFYHSIEEYDVETDSWSMLSTTNLPYGRCRFGCVAVTVAPQGKETATLPLA